MTPDDLPPPSARFGIQKQTGDFDEAEATLTLSSSKGRAAGRDPGPRRVSFETTRDEREELAGSFGVAGVRTPQAQSQTPSPGTPPIPRGRTPRVPGPQAAGAAASSAASPGEDEGGSPPGSLAFQLPPSRLGPAGSRPSTAFTGAGAAAEAQAAGSAAAAAATASDGGASELSLNMNASMRRTRRRHAAAAAAMTTGNVLGPAPVPAAAAAAVAAAATARAGGGSSGAAAATADQATPSGPPEKLAPARDGGAPAAPGEGGGGGGAPEGYAAAAAVAVAAAEGGAADQEPEPPSTPICGPLYTKPIPPNVLAITVARSEALRMDPMLTSPVVRIHCLDANTGQYLVSLDNPFTGLLDGVKAVQILEYAGRPSQMTVANNSDFPAASILRAIPPIQTEPFELLSRPEARTMAAWEETLLIDEAVERFVGPDPLLIFEMIQLPVSYRRYRKHIREFDTEDGSHLIAWAFLRPAGPRPESPEERHQPLFGRLKLQLYEYKKDISDVVRRSNSAAPAATPAAGGTSGAAAPPPSGPLHLNAASRAYVNWQALMAEGGAAVVPKYPSALTVVLQAVPRPKPEIVTTVPEEKMRPYLPAGYGSGFETSTVPLSAYLGGADGQGDALLGEAVEDITKNKYYRPITEPCKIPNVPLRKLSGGPQGVTCMAFSHGGTFLAVVTSEGDDRARIVIYSTLTGAAKRTIYCAHNGFVYDIAWARDDMAIITASADGTAKIWELNPAAAAAAMAAAEAAVEAAAAGGAKAATTGAGAADAAAAAAAAVPAMSLLTTMKPGAARPTSAPAATQASTTSANPNASFRMGGSGATTSATPGNVVSAPALASVKGGALPYPTVLRHACYVYTAQFHPVQKPGSALVATGAYDGTVRLWRRYTGELLAAVKTQSGCINSLCFDKLGTRLYSADSAGVLQEFSCDVNKGVEAVAAAPGGTNLKISTISTGNAGGGGGLNATLMSSTIRKRLTMGGTGGGGGGGGSSGPVNLNASMLPRSTFNFSASMRPKATSGSGDPGGGAGGGADGAGGGLNATQGSSAAADSAAAAAAAAAAANILRVLRQCDEFDGEPLSQVFPHHDGRRLGLLTKRSRLLVVETRSLSRAEQFLGLRCREAPLKASFSPDGRYLISGSEDGRVMVWDADGGPPTLLPHFTLGGDTVFQVVWNPQFHIAAVCSFASWAPVLMLAYDSSLPDVALQMGHKNPLELMARDKKKAEAVRPRWDIPDQLTPEFLRIMLNDIRRDARERGIIGDPNDPNGDHLVVPRSRLAELRAKAAEAAAAAAAAAAPPPPPATPPPPPRATPLPPTSATSASIDASGLPELPGSRFKTPQGPEAGPAADEKSESIRSKVHFADEQPPPATAATSPPPATEPEPSPAEPAPQQQQQEYQWSHPQPKKPQDQAMAAPPPAAATAPTRLRQQQQEFAQQQLLQAQQQRWRYPASLLPHAQPQPQVPYLRALYGQMQQYQWNKEVQEPDPLPYSQVQRAAEQAARDGPKQYPPQAREVQLAMYDKQYGPMALQLQQMPSAADYLRGQVSMQAHPQAQSYWQQEQLLMQQQQQQQQQQMQMQQQRLYGSPPRSPTHPVYVSPSSYPAAQVRQQPFPMQESYGVQPQPQQYQQQPGGIERYQQQLQQQQQQQRLYGSPPRSPPTQALYAPSYPTSHPAQLELQQSFTVQQSYGLQQQHPPPHRRQQPGGAPAEWQQQGYLDDHQRYGNRGQLPGPAHFDVGGMRAQHLTYGGAKVLQYNKPQPNLRQQQQQQLHQLEQYQQQQMYGGQGPYGQRPVYEQHPSQLYDQQQELQQRQLQYQPQQPRQQLSPPRYHGFGGGYAPYGPQHMQQYERPQYLRQQA